MSDPLHIQIDLKAPPQTVFRALTDAQALAGWFAEYVDVSLEEGRFDFWGRFTPGTPDQELGRHTLEWVDGSRGLRFAWNLQDQETQVEFHLLAQGEGTLLVLRHFGVPRGQEIGFATTEDFWFLSLENLRRFLDGHAVVRCDFSTMRPGDIRHEIEIDAPRAEVFGALIRPDQLNRWIASRAAVEPRVRGRYDLGWQGAGALKILELASDEKLALRLEDGSNTIVTWTLEESNGRTRLTLIHSGFAPDQPTGGLNAGWLNFMSWIKSLVEYGPEWQTPVIWLPVDLTTFYSATIGARQSEVVFIPISRSAQPVQPGFKLGTYAEIDLGVPDLSTALAFYERLGFVRLDASLLTDGFLNFRLHANGLASPTLSYFGSDLARLQAAGWWQGINGEVSFTDVNRLHIHLSARTSPQEMPPRRPVSRCGTFGELAIPCADLQTSIAFWQRLGFNPTHVADAPCPWAILVDGLVVLGLHQTRDFTTPHLTYFAPDMGERIASLQADGVALTDLGPGNAAFTAPGGQRFFLFTGEV